jgi:hypothetical protein
VITDQGHWTFGLFGLFLWTTDYAGPLAEFAFLQPSRSYALMKFNRRIAEGANLHSCNGCRCVAEEVPLCLCCCCALSSCPLPDARCLMLAA